MKFTFSKRPGGFFAECPSIWIVPQSDCFLVNREKSLFWQEWACDVSLYHPWWCQVWSLDWGWLLWCEGTLFSSLSNLWDDTLELYAYPQPSSIYRWILLESVIGGSKVVISYFYNFFYTYELQFVSEGELPRLHLLSAFEISFTLCHLE